MDINRLFNLGMDRYIPQPLPDNDKGVILNLGAGNKMIDQSIPLDYPDWDADQDPIPFENSTVSMIHAYHFLEHCADPVHVLHECQRVLMPGGHINIIVPYYNSQMAAQDLDHKSQFCEMTWKTTFDNPYYDKRPIQWELKIHLNVIIGIVERNICLLTQLQKLP